MNYDEALSAGGRSASRVRSPVRVDRSLYKPSDATSFLKDYVIRPCDIARRMKYVSMSCQDSVSLFCQKVERVEGHEIARMSDDAVKSSNGNNTRPFDLCLEKKGIRLKPCFLELNREKRRATKVAVDRFVDESSGNMGRGSRGGGRRTSLSSRNNSPLQVYVRNTSQVSNVGLVEKETQQEIKSREDEGAPFKCSGDNKDLLQPSASCSSKNITLSGGSSVPRECEDVKDVARMSCDLVNRMENVSFSFSGLKSVPSTSDVKVELSSVEDYDTAHKSGDVRNASNGNSTIPFDLFLEKKGTRLKPSLKELNQEKRRETKGYTGIVIRPGMVLLRNYLSINDQVMIVKKCRELGLGEGGFYQPGYRDGASLHLKMMCLGKNWDCETRRYGETRSFDGSTPPQIPAEFSQLVEKAIKDSQSLVATTSSKKTKGEVEIPFMSPDICIANFYTSTGRLGLHQDKGESAESILKGLPIVSFSIGDSAEFVFSDQRNNDKAETVVLQSGDVLLFGGKSRNVFHGVRSILKDTTPRVLSQETSLRPGRLNLTFRQY